MGNQGTVQHGGHAPVPGHPWEQGSTYLWGALLQLGRLWCASGQAQAAAPVAAAALALGALQAQLPGVLHGEAGREHQVPLCPPLIPPNCGPEGFGWVSDTSSAFRLGLSTAASTPEPPTLQDFLGLAQNTTH